MLIKQITKAINWCRIWRPWASHCLLVFFIFSMYLLQFSFQLVWYPNIIPINKRNLELVWSSNLTKICAQDQSEGQGSRKLGLLWPLFKTHVVEQNEKYYEKSKDVLSFLWLIGHLDLYQIKYWSHCPLNIQYLISYTENYTRFVAV